MQPSKLLKVEYNILPRIELVQLKIQGKLLPVVENGKKRKLQTAKYQEFASRLKNLMDKDDSPIKTVNQLKDAIEVTYEMARRYTLGIAKPREQKMQVLAEKFNVDISFLDHGSKQIISKKCDLAGIWIPIKSFSKMDSDGYFRETENSKLMTEGYLPFCLASANTFAIYATGGVLHPAIKDGWFIICDPNSPLNNGEFVQLNLKDGRKTIKELISIINNLYIFQDVNSGERTSFERTEIDSIFAVIGISPPSRYKENID